MQIVNAIIDILNDFKIWGLAILAPLSMVIIIIDVMKYKGGDEAERTNIKRRIRNTILISGGVYVLIWILEYIISKISSSINI